MDSIGTGVGIVVVAAGSGTRLEHPRRKAFARVGERSILEHSLDSIFAMSRPARVVVVAPSDELEEAAELCSRSAGAAGSYLTVVPGGATRQASVAAGLAGLDPSIDFVLVHDAARAFTPTEQFDRVIDAVVATRAGIVPVLPVTDTIKHADAAGRVLGTLDRSALVAVQTPQGFPREQLDAAYAAATEDFTDDAAVFAANGGTVTTVAGDVLAFKITTPWDLRRAEAVAGERAATRASAAARGAMQSAQMSLDVRTGVGVDVHAVDPGSPLWLGGVHWPGEHGLSGHSDGDALCHAICDALLSASGLGDIGGLFGTSDPRFAGAHGDVFVRETVARVTDAGFSIGNVAVQVVAKHPKLGPRRSELERILSGFVGAPVSVSATTTDGLGFTGRGDGVAVIATALVHRSR